MEHYGVQSWLLAENWKEMEFKTKACEQWMGLLMEIGLWQSLFLWKS